MHVDELKFNSDGLIPCITQDHEDGQILMLAYMNRESFLRTLESGKACYYSRSRRKLWLKGEESGNVQIVKSVSTDCDKDALLIKVEQLGGCSCHHGYRSCFYRDIDGSGWEIVMEKVKDPEKMYGKKSPA